MSSVSCKDQTAGESNYHRLRQVLCELPYIVCKEELSLSISKERTLQYSLKLMNLLATKREDLLRAVAERRKQLLPSTTPKSMKQPHRSGLRQTRQRSHNRSPPTRAVSLPTADLDPLAAFSPSSVDGKQQEQSARLLPGGSYVLEEPAAATDAASQPRRKEDSSFTTEPRDASTNHDQNCSLPCQPSRWSSSFMATHSHASVEMTFTPWPQQNQLPAHQHNHNPAQHPLQRTEGDLRECEKICGV
jgi:hypothetical protein